MPCIKPSHNDSKTLPCERWSRLCWAAPATASPNHTTWLLFQPKTRFSWPSFQLVCERAQSHCSTWRTACVTLKVWSVLRLASSFPCTWGGQEVVRRHLGVILVSVLYHLYVWVQCSYRDILWSAPAWCGKLSFVGTLCRSVSPFEAVLCTLVATRPTESHADQLRNSFFVKTAADWNHLGQHHRPRRLCSAFGDPSSDHTTPVGRH